MHFFSKLALVILVINSFYLSANERDGIFSYSLEELMNITVVTAASGFEQKATQAPAAVTVITYKEWQAMGARSLSDVLKSVPGVHVSKPQGDFMHKKFIIRGLSGTSSTQIKLLIDGEPFEWMQSNSLPVGFQMPLTSFERIEVIKGPGSVVYGADAYAGVINLVSFKRGKIPSGFGGRAGSFNTYDLFGRHSFSIGESDMQWSFDYTKSDDDSNRIVNADLQSTFDGLFGTTASKAPGPIDEHYEILTFLAQWQWKKLNIDYFTWHNFDMGIGAGPAQVLVPNGQGSSYADQLKATYDFSDIVPGELKATFSYKNQRTKLHMNVFPAGAILPIGEDGNLNFVDPSIFTLFDKGFIGTPSPGGDSKTFRLSHLVNLSESYLLRWELGYEKQRFRPRESKNFGPGVLDGSQSIVDEKLKDVTGTEYLYIPNVDRDFYYLSVQNELRVNDDLLLTLGLRYDEYSDFGSTTNPRLGLNWSYTDKISFKVFAGSAFRAPSFFQLYASNNPVNIGNSSLKPETINTIETGFNAKYIINKNLIASINFYNYHAKDLIDFLFDDKLKGNVAQNIGEQEGKGGEIWLKWKPINDIVIDFNYSHITAKDGSHRDIIDIPKDMVYFKLNWNVSDDWAWNLDAKSVSNRKRAPTDSRKNIADYIFVSTKLSRKNITSGLNMALIINNVLNEDFREPSNGNIPDDYPLMGRSVMLEVGYDF
jgi:iron complex outermembrane receptor protein